MFNKRPKDTTKKYCWLYLHCTYNYLRCWKGLASCSSDPSLSLPDSVWPRESEIGEKRVGTRLLWSFTIPPCFALKTCSKKTKTLCYPLLLFGLKQNYANRKTKLRISEHFCSILGCWKITLSSIKTKNILSKDYASIYVFMLGALGIMRVNGGYVTRTAFKRVHHACCWVVFK